MKSLPSWDLLEELAYRAAWHAAEAAFDYTPVFPAGVGHDEGTYLYDTVCSAGCGHEFTFVCEDEERYVGDVHMCIKCARSAGDFTLHTCWNCGVVFQSSSRYAETCSGHCGWVVDGLAEKAHEAELERERRWLEAM